MLKLGSSLVRGGASLLTFVKDNLKLYLDFTSTKSDTLKFPSEGSTDFELDNTQYIKIPHSADLSLGTDPHTIACWAKFENLGNYRTLISKRGTGTDYNLAVGLNGEIYTYNGSAVAQSANSVISAGIWYHIALVYNGSAYVLYVDGVVKPWSSGTTTSGSANTDPLYIGYSSNASEYMDGKMANVAIWKRDLSQEEIQSIMNKSYSQLKGVETTSLASWWGLDNSSDRGADFWDVGVFTQEGSPTTSTYSNGLLNVVGNGNNTGARFSFPDTGSTSIEGYNQYEFSFDIKITSGAGSAVKIQYHYSGAISSTFNDVIDTTEAPNQEFKRFVTTLYNDNSLSSNRYFVFVQNNASPTAEFQVKNIVLKPITANDSKGSNHGQLVQETTTTTSVYGGNAPILPRAVDVAKEGQADAIGDGSASFNGSSNYVSIPTQFSGGNAYSVSAWVYSSSSRNIINQCDTIGRSNIYIQRVDTNAYRAYLSSNNNTTYKYVTTNNGVATVGGWDFVTVTFNVATNTILIYVNGILQSTTSNSGGTNATAMSINTNACAIGVRPKTTPDTYWDGNIAQVGFWQGILDQPKVQKLYESTSYSKIPADVKSTLGSEILTTNVNTDWSAYGSNNVDNVTDGIKITHVNNAGGAARTIAGSSGKLYKVVFNAYYSGGTAPNVKVWTGAVNSGTQALTTSSTQYIIYFVNAGTSSLYFDSVNSSQEIFITNLSAKEVTNDIFAYYPLDGNSEVKGLSFDGINDFIETSSNVGITGASARTFGLWFTPDSVSDTNWLLEWGTQGTARAVSGFYLYQSKIFFYGWTGSGDLDTGTAPLSGWQHLYATYDGTTVKVYLNGSLIGSGARSLETTNTTLKIGAGKNTSGGLTSPLSGSISSVSIYDVAKTADEINSMYQQGIGGDESSNSGLVGYWKLDNATTVTDLSGNGNNGTVNGGATLISAGTTDSVGNNDGGLL